LNAKAVLVVKIIFKPLIYVFERKLVKYDLNLPFVGLLTVCSLKIDTKGSLLREVVDNQHENS
jgi:hypothetical protein